MSEYSKIQTVYDRDVKTFKVKPGVFRDRTNTIPKVWQWTEKVDGMNMRIIWNNLSKEVSFRGRTDNAEIPSNLIHYLYSLKLEDKLVNIFHDVSAIIYGEGFGAGIQKGSKYSQLQRFIIFDVKVEDKWWLNHENVIGIATKLELPVVPDFGLMTIEEATEKVKVGFDSQVFHNEQDKPKAEGLVGQTTEPLFNKYGDRLIIKLKTKDF